MQDIFFSGIAMALIWQRNIPHRAAMSLDCIKQAFGLNREGAWVVIGITMNQQQRCFYFVRKAEWRHVIINFRSFPIGSFLTLKSERGKRPVVCSAAGNTGFEQLRMCEQVSCHKRTVTVASDGYPVAVTNTSFCHGLDSGMRIQVKLGDEVIVWFLPAFTNYWHLCVI